MDMDQNRIFMLRVLLTPTIGNNQKEQCEMEDLLIRLKRAILPYHDAVHGLPILRDLPEGAIDLPGYRRLLERIYGFWDPVESALYDSLSTQPKSSYSWNPRIPLLVNDLAFLGVSASELESIPRRKQPQPIRFGEALGYLYLSEGSRLGGRILGQIVRNALALTPYTGFSYFSSGGADVDELWEAFKTFLRTCVDTPELEQEIILSSRNGFAGLNQWLAGE
jgi:heme oxygenase